MIDKSCATIPESNRYIHNGDVIFVIKTIININNSPLPGNKKQRCTQSWGYTNRIYLEEIVVFCEKNLIH